MTQQNHAIESYLSKITVRLADAEFGCDWDVSYENYLFRCVARRAGYEEFDHGKSLYLDTFLIFSELTSPNMVSLRAFSSKCLRYLGKSKRIARPEIMQFSRPFADVPFAFGLPSLCVPVAITQGIEPSISQTIQHQLMSSEIPVVCDLVSGMLHYCKRRPLLRRAFYDFFEDKVVPLIAP